MTDGGSRVWVMMGITMFTFPGAMSRLLVGSLLAVAAILPETAFGAKRTHPPTKERIARIRAQIDRGRLPTRLPAERAPEFDDEQRLMEKLWGQYVAAAQLQSEIVLRAPQVEAEIRRLAKELMAGAGTPKDVRVRLLNNPVANAVVTPNGEIFVSAALLELVADRDELAFVLAHEIGHAIMHHGMDLLENQFKTGRRAEHTTALLSTLTTAAAQGAIGRVGAGATAGMGSSLGDVAAHTLAREVVMSATGALATQVSWNIALWIAQMQHLGYGRSKELEADRIGVEILLRCGFRPEAAVSALEKLEEARQRTDHLMSQHQRE